MGGEADAAAPSPPCVDDMDEAALRVAVAEAREEARAAKAKMDKWKEKMKGIIEAERAEITTLRQEKEAELAATAALQLEVAQLKQQRDLGQMQDVSPASASASASHEAGSAAAAVIARLEAEKAALSEDFERFKERTNVAMKLRGKELASKTSQHSTLEEDLKAAQAELMAVKDTLARRSREHEALEEQAAQASVAVARQLESAAQEAEQLKTMYESEKMVLVARQREALHELRDAHETQMAETVQMYEQDTTLAAQRLDEAEANVVSKSQARVDELIAANAELSAEVETLRRAAEDTRLQQQRDRDLHRVSSGGSWTGADGASACAGGGAVAGDDLHRQASGSSLGRLEAANRDLQGQVRRLTEDAELQGQRLWALQREVIEAKDKAGVLRPRHGGGGVGGGGGGGGGDLSEDQTRSYMKGVILKFLTSASDDVQCSLVPVLATLLHLTPAELKEVYMQHPTWTVQ